MEKVDIGALGSEKPVWVTGMYQPLLPSISARSRRVTCVLGNQVEALIIVRLANAFQSQSKLSDAQLKQLQKDTHFDKKELQQWYKGVPDLSSSSYLV